MTDSPAPAAVVFDLDGTLVDSRPDLTRAVVALRAELGLAAVDEATVGAWIGEGARRLVEKALAGSAHPLEPALARFLALYEPICTERTFPYPGVEELVASLRGRVPMALLTNKPERMTRRIVDHLGWTNDFAPLVGGDTLPVRKPDPGGLRTISEALGLAPRDLLLVGDSSIDRDTAAACGAAFVWAEWGYAQPGERDLLARERRAETPRDLWLLLDGRGEKGSLGDPCGRA